MTTSPTGSVEPVHKRLVEISSSYSGYIMPQNKELWKKMFEEIDRSMASEVRKARTLPKPIESTSDIRCGNSRPLKERKIVMIAYNKCLRDIAELEGKER